jgi:hypothetical protein
MWVGVHQTKMFFTMALLLFFVTSVQNFLLLMQIYVNGAMHCFHIDQKMFESRGNVTNTRNQLFIVDWKFLHKGNTLKSCC